VPERDRAAEDALVTSRRTELAAAAALVAVTAVWGSTFVVVKDAVERMPVLDFLTWRFALAALAMVLLRPRAVARLGTRGRREGLWLGLALAVGYGTQTFGLQHTSASVSGFITGMFVVFTPLIAGLLLHRTVGSVAWIAVAVATAGLALLSLHGFRIGGGEALTVLTAIAFAAHIVGLGEWSAGRDPVGLAVVQLIVVVVVCGVPAVLGGITAPPDAGVWGALALTALAGTALAFLVQTWAQAHLAPTRAAVVLTMEPVFAGVFGVLVAGDSFGPRTAAGAVLVLAAMLLVELGPRGGAEGAVERLEA
jgi:drug/metabolite transporter (DMT)-like permease